jgi:hypothetical protein
MDLNVYVAGAGCPQLAMLKIYVEKLEQDVRCDAYAPGATSFPALSLSHSLSFFL